MSLFWKFFGGVVDKAFAKEQAVFDELAPTAVGRPVDDVAGDLRAAMTQRKIQISDADLRFYAERLVRGEKIVVGEVVDQPGSPEGAVER